ncbi:unnamed protein product [Pneumocystis jirovecii]|uniref:Uncharacterized protein n=1 Tax=Pneumocystis jirovecii TaxID=42068 RepID=L0PGE2_PNEJI|nr:unnamed protein product [Pneumocystis jirovecii]
MFFDKYKLYILRYIVFTVNYKVFWVKYMGHSCVLMIVWRTVSTSGWITSEKNFIYWYGAKEVLKTKGSFLDVGDIDKDLL